MIDGVAAAFAVTAGALTFLSPCGIPMLPAYVAYYLGAQAGDRIPVAAAVARGLRGGLAAAAGGLAVFAVVAAGAWLVGRPFKESIIHLELLGGALVIALGVLTLLGRGPAFRFAATPPQRRGAAGLAGFGALYAAVGAGCSAPLLLATITLGLRDGSLATLLLLYALGLVGLLAAVTVAISVAGHGVAARLRAVVPYVRFGGGIVLLAVGAYLVAYWALNGGPETLADQLR